MNLPCTVWKLRKFTLTLFWKKFQDSNIFTKDVDLTKFFFSESISVISTVCRELIDFFIQSIHVTQFKFNDYFFLFYLFSMNYLSVHDLIEMSPAVTKHDLRYFPDIM